MFSWSAFIPYYPGNNRNDNSDTECGKADFNEQVSYQLQEWVFEDKGISVSRTEQYEEKLDTNNEDVFYKWLQLASCFVLPLNKVNKLVLIFRSR